MYRNFSTRFFSENTTKYRTEAARFRVTHVSPHLLEYSQEQVAVPCTS